MNFDEYRAVPAINISSLLHLARSPRHYLHALEQAEAGVAGKDTPAMKFGRLVHLAIFEPERFEAEVVVWANGDDGEPRRRAGKDWTAFKAAADLAGKTIATEEEHLTCLAMSVAVHEHQAAAAYLLGAKNVLTEHTLRSQHRLGLELKGRLDWIDLDTHTIVDLKTAKDATEVEFGKSAARLRYPTRAAFYADLYEAEYGHTPSFVIIAVEKEEPYAVAVYRVEEDVLDAGRREYTELLERLVVCRKSGEFPGIANDRETSLVMPSWAFAPDLGLELQIDGESFSV